jgi:TolA-binding protein
MMPGMNNSLQRWLVAGAVAGCVSCGGGGTADNLKLFPIDESGSGLRISQQEYRFGTSEVGDSTVKTFVIANEGVDTYPLNSLRIQGRDAEEFSVGDDALVLEPGDRYRFDVAFRPQSAGQKLATLDVDFDTIVSDSDATLATEAVFYQAKGFEQSGDLMAAEMQYRRYVNAVPTENNKTRAMVRLPLLAEADVYGTDQGFDEYRQALDERDLGEHEQAIALLDLVIESHPDGYLADDASYMVGYIKINDLGEYQQGLDRLESLMQQYPDSSYIDTALYGQAVAYAGLGNNEAARSVLSVLLDRHTAITIGDQGYRWPKDNFVARMWFEKSEAMLLDL